ncbi:RNA polymerase sigma factor [Dyadobacter chenwenxiniae]|uniref:RNA polymerase sigma factor n=1 Tax=Dyadobacter chenwenxiniae TaxID=2906456 RepID=A0A9X1TG54_9BACT|nr:RNA polymerase sigma factor [Dyadobacter chenwenxiniae]MCF0065111.1 RNA polymerase sigma factor [Dyadobacter chenwenxiniae]UON84617.1 RNA polymerase sigma factor [Dyadobacter chenwenxiniae]
MPPVTPGAIALYLPVEWLSDCTTDEKQWIERCAKKDPKAQQWVFKHFFGLAMGICVRYLSVYDLAQEAVSDSFLKIFDQLPRQLSEIRSFRAWMRAMVVRTAIDYFRKEKKNFAVTSLDAVDGHAEIDEQVTSKQSVAEILQLLDKLPPVWKVVFNLYEVEGYSHEEIGKMLSITASSSRVYLAKGKQSLRKMIAIQNGSN